MAHANIILDEPAIRGDTTRFIAHVRTFAGNLTDVVTGGFIVYDDLENVVAIITGADLIRDALGQYHGAWQVPAAQPNGRYIVEFFGQVSADDPPDAFNRERAYFLVQFA